MWISDSYHEVSEFTKSCMHDQTWIPKTGKGVRQAQSSLPGYPTPHKVKLRLHLLVSQNSDAKQRNPHVAGGGVDGAGGLLDGLQEPEHLLPAAAAPLQELPARGGPEPMAASAARATHSLDTACSASGQSTRHVASSLARFPAARRPEVRTSPIRWLGSSSIEKLAAPSPSSPWIHPSFCDPRLHAMKSWRSWPWTTTRHRRRCR